MTGLAAGSLVDLGADIVNSSRLLCRRKIRAYIQSEESFV
jgi:hypothetical protein